MCRFFVANFDTPQDPTLYLKRFALMAKNSKAYDGDWQGDGWGVGYEKEGVWHTYHSLLPVWEDSKNFENIPQTKALAIHARSASFAHHKNNISYNQPFIDETRKYLFVFNGLLKGVKIPSTPGTIGSQKIWYLLQKNLREMPPREALLTLQTYLEDHCDQIVALNCALATTDTHYSINQYSKYPDYYKLHTWHESGNITCSEPLPEV